MEAGKRKGRKVKLYVVLSFAAMFLIAIPIWWKSTEIYRAELPYEDIKDWNEKKIYETPFLINLDVYLPSSWLLSTVEESQVQLDLALHNAQPESPNTSNILYKSIIHREDKPKSFDCDEAANFLKVGSRNGRYAFIHVTPDENKKLFTICPDRIVLMRQEAVGVNLNSLFSSIAQLATKRIISSPYTEEKSRKKIQSNSGFRITFTLLQDSLGWNSPFTSWAFPEFADGILHKFFSQLEATATIHIDSQIKHFVPLEREPAEDFDHFYFSSSVLPHILAHPHEWNSDFVATQQPSLHFMVYVPKKEISPLYLHEESQPDMKHHAYIIPQTGGVYIYNRKDNGTESFLSQSELKSAVSMFLTQLRETFGLESIEDVSFFDGGSIEILPSSSGVAVWERDQFIRERTFENLFLATRNLQSLSELVQKLTIMPISDDIQIIVTQAIDAVQKSYDAIIAQDYETAQKESRLAMEKAHTAFFDPDMLSLLYFPDEHKLAIYAPFLPISIPLLLKLISSLKKEIRGRKVKKKKEGKDAEEEKKEKKD